MDKRHRVALIGIGCRYCGIKDQEDFRKTLELERCDGLPVNGRFREYGELLSPEPDARGKYYCREGFFLADALGKFDNDFFGISEREAGDMDYQQRMLLQVMQEAAEDAGVILRGSDAAVFVGAFMQDHLINTMQLENFDNLNGYYATGTSIGMLANRISYCYDLHGPSMTVDTACSSSLTALHLAAESIALSECSVAVCAGVNLITAPGNFITLCKGGFLSKASRCQAFAEEADGYARGEGAGVLILKDLEQARADGDRIYCEIMATAVNHDGRKKGVTWPDSGAQVRLLRKIYGGKGIPADALGYLEAHGTGTQAGDKAETAALQAVFGDRKESLAIGSVKTNIGHTEAAAGIASVIKGVITLQNRRIYKTLHCERKNPLIPWEKYRIAVSDRALPLPAAGDGRYYVGINGFGFGGSNAHAVLGSMEAMPVPKSGDEPGLHNFYLAANSRSSIFALGRDYQYSIQAGKLSRYSLAQICDCAAARREHDYPFRLAITAGSKKELAAGLAAFEKEAGHTALKYRQRVKKRQKTAAIFSGMGVMQEAHGKELYRVFPVFRESFGRCSEAFVKAGGRSLVQVIESEEAYEGFLKVGFLQPYNLAYQISLYELVRSFGVEVKGCMGHSAGELAAFYCSGFAALDEIFRIAFHRGRVQQKLQGKGRMLAVGMSGQEIAQLCAAFGDKISIAVENGKESIVVAGDEESLRELKEQLPDAVSSRLLHGDIAYHSSQMEEIKEDFLGSLMPEPGRAAGKELYSTVFAGRLDDKAQDYDSMYWWKNVRNKVKFFKTIQKMHLDGYDSFIEIGAAPVLMSYIAEVFTDGNPCCVAFQQRNTGEVQAVYNGAAQAYISYMPMDFAAVCGTQPMLPLPEYRWDFKWLPNYYKKDNYLTQEDSNPLLGRRLNYPGEMWENRLSQFSHMWTSGHRIEKDCYLPAAAYIAMLYETGRKVLKDIRIPASVVIDRIQDTIMNLSISADGAVSADFTNADRKRWTNGFRAEAGLMVPSGAFQTGAAVKEGDAMVLGHDIVYRILDEKGLHYGGDFLRIESACVGRNTVSAALQIHKSDFTPGTLTGILDSMLQAAALAGGRDPARDRQMLFLPAGMEESIIMDHPGNGVLVRAEIRECTAESMKADVSLHDGSGQCVAVFKGVLFKAKKRDLTDDYPGFAITWERLKTAQAPADPAAGDETIIWRACGDIYRDAQELQKVISQMGDKGGKLLAVTHNAVKAAAEDRAEGFMQSGLYGLCRCASLEYPQLSIVMADTDSEVPDPRLRYGLPEGESQLALRGPDIYGMRITRSQEREDLRLSGEDTAVITGAAGGLAYHYALALARSGCGNIALLSRGETARTQTLSAVLRYYGVKVSCFQADITDRQAVESCFQRIKKDASGEIYIYHLAAYNKDVKFSEITQELLAAHIGPKVAGAENLLRAMGGRAGNLTAVGSVVAVLGNHGQGPYAAANRALLGFCEANGCRYTGFGAIAAGMLSDKNTALRAFELQGVGVMDADRAIGTALTQPGPAGFVADLNWRKALAIRSAGTDKAFSYVRESNEKESFSDRFRSADYRGQRDMLEDLLQTIYARVLETDHLFVILDRPVDTMGIHSLNAALIANYVRQKTETSFTEEKAAGPYTLRELAGEIQQEMLSR